MIKVEIKISGSVRLFGRTIEWPRHSDQNFHGKGTGNTVKGPRFTWVYLNGKPEQGKRFIFYWPSGAWTSMDVTQ